MSIKIEAVEMNNKDVMPLARKAHEAMMKEGRGMNERPTWNTAPIRCGRSKCKWRGYEGDLIDERRKEWTQKVCPECGCAEYTFMTPGEIKAWERRKAKEQK